MNLFYTGNLEVGTVVLDEEESKHFKVLRINEGENVLVSDGNGKYAEVVVKKAGKKNVELLVEEVNYREERKPYKLTIAIAPTKHNDRTEWFIEKAVEIGVDRIIFLNTKNTERNKINLERFKKIARSAGKQSLTFILPQMEGLIKYETFLGGLKGDDNFIALCNADFHIGEVLKNKNGKSFTFVVGPEGGFTEEELLLSNKYGLKPVKLSSKRLRTETAGVFIATALEVV